MRDNKRWLAFRIRMPEELIPTYDYLQGRLNAYMTGKTYRKALLSIDPTRPRGDVWRDLNTIFHSDVQSWTIPNRAWYARIVFENIRRELESKRERVIIHEALTASHMEVTETMLRGLHARGIHPKRGYLTNLVRSHKKPELAHHLTLNLDYSVSNQQMFTMDARNHCRIRILDGSWLDYQVILPSSLFNPTGRIAKPRFVRRPDGSYSGVCSYEYATESSDGSNILGVDLGRVKLFSAVALRSDDTYGDEYIQSRRSTGLMRKLDRLYDAKSRLWHKIQTAESYHSSATPRQSRRIIEYEALCGKIERFKHSQALLTASEIVSLAKQESCGEIHMENLSWLGSRGGKWNYSDVQSAVEVSSVKNGLKLVRVNAAHSSDQHPETGEIGRASGRSIVFTSGEEVDRDALAAVNLARRSRRRVDRRVKLKPTRKRSRPVVKESRRREIREIVKKLKGDSQIVVPSPCKANAIRVAARSVTRDSTQPGASLMVRGGPRTISINI